MLMEINRFGFKVFRLINTEFKLNHENNSFKFAM